MDNIENPLFVLLNYHQFIEMCDAAERQAELSAEQRPVSQTPPPWGRADTPKTLYRENHITNESWTNMTFQEKNDWTRKMIKKTGKSVVW